MDDRLATPRECRAQAAHCRMLADTETDERVRGLFLSMARMWTKLAEEAERLQPSKVQGGSW
jgi:hypothetical protein